MSDESLIVTECPFCETAMDITAVAPFARVACPSCHGEMRVKVKFGPYQLERRLAVGGMSVVFVGRDTLLDREVAVKILNEDFSADERRIAAFEEEARITASISHPNIVRVLTTGRAFERFFIAMELVPGGHFEQHIHSRGKVPEKEMLKLAIQIANGLKAAHAANLIHRDIKPGNILLDADGNAKIVDFGLALVTQGGMARAKEFWATPYYVPPETIDGAAEDFRADIYAFGATVYHALAGKPPCNEESMATDVLRAAKKQVVPLHVVEPGLSQAMCAIVERTMAYQPGDRYSSYDELLRDLEAAAKNVKLGIAGETAGDASSRKARRERKQRLVRASVVLVGGVALIGGLAWILGGKDDVPDDPAPVVVQGETVDDGGAEVVDVSQLGKLHEDARSAMASRSYGAAVDRYLRLFENVNVQEPTRTWAGVQALVAAMIDEDGERVVGIAGALLAHAVVADSGDAGLAGVVMPVVGQVGDGRAVSFEGSEPEATSAAGQVAWLMAGLSQWRRESPQAAVPALRRVVEAELDEGSGWAGIYQNVARDHLADVEMLEDPLMREDPRNLESAEMAVEAMENMRTQVRSRGRIHEILQERQEQLRRILKDFRKQAEREALAQQEDGERTDVELTDPFVPELPEEVEEVEEVKPDKGAVRDLLMAYDFRKARHMMRELNEEQIETRQRTVWMALTRNAQEFIPGLLESFKGGTATFPEAKLKSGATHADFRVDADGNLVSGDGERFGWEEVHPNTLIEMHRERARRMTDEFERKTAHEMAIAFDLLVGDRQRAVGAIEMLSKDDANFERYWSFVIANLPQ